MLFRSQEIGQDEQKLYSHTEGQNSEYSQLWELNMEDCKKPEAVSQVEAPRCVYCPKFTSKPKTTVP